MARVATALQAAGLDAWTVGQQQDEGQLLVTVMSSATPGYVWLRPHFTESFAQLQLPVAVAVEAIHRAAHARLDAGADPHAFATPDEALAVWEQLVTVAEGAPL